MTAVLVAEDVRRTYGDTVALDGVSLSVGEGEVFALVGPNGAGKTTLVRALTGTTDARGDVSVFGSDPRSVDRERIGLLPQDFDPPDRLTARELLAYYRGLYDDGRDVAPVLADVGLADDADTWYENLSGGQRRRTCVGAALVNDPDLLFLDEPTTGIDPAGRRTLWRLLEDLAAGGATIVLTTHDMAEAHRLADRVGLLADGDLVAVDDPDALVAEYGGPSRLIVEIDAGVGSDPATADLDLPHELERREGELVVLDVSPVDIGGVVDALEVAGVAYDALAWTEPTLEDVYLSLAADETVDGDAALGGGRPGRPRSGPDPATEGDA